MSHRFTDSLRAGSGRNCSSVVPSWSCSQAVSKPVRHTPLLCVQWKTPDDGQRNCPKHVEFYSKNKFEKLVHLLLLLPLALQPTVGFGLSNNILPFFSIRHQLPPSSHSQYLNISFYFLFTSFPGSSPSPRPFQFLSEDLYGYPIPLHSLQVT